MARLAHIERSVDIDVPRRTVFHEATRFRDLSWFLGDPGEVRQIDATHARWQTRGLRRSAPWTAEILELVPDRRVEWRSTDGSVPSAMINFVPLSDLKTRLTVRIEILPDAFPQAPAELLALLSRRLEEKLRRFKEHLEAGGDVQGTWRRMLTHPESPGAEGTPPGEE